MHSQQAVIAKVISDQKDLSNATKKRMPSLLIARPLNDRLSLTSPLFTLPSMAQMQNIRKRDGRIVIFDQSKIAEAIWKAAESVGGTDRSEAEKIANQVAAVVEVFFKGPDAIPSVEQIQDLVEKILIEGGHAKTAKAYILYRADRAREREQRELILGKGNADENLNFSNNALEVLKRRYLLKDEDGSIKETPRQLVERISGNIAQADKNYGASESEYQATAKSFFDVMANLEFMPNTPTIMNAGTDIQQLSACFVLPVPDSIEGIFDALKYQAIIHKSGGGTGFSFSRLRPGNDMVRSTAGVSSGPVSFMKIFDAATQEIKQGGKRRGANMGILRIDHPDVLDFIVCKADMKTLTNFNISVGVTNKFMEALKKDELYDLINPRTKRAVKQLRAREVFNLVIQNAWLNGDPGLVFIDRMNETNPTPHLGEIEATNPCGEQDLLPYDSCNLGSIAVNRFISADRKDFDWDRLKETVYTTTHFLDNVIDMNNYPIPQIAEMSRLTRRIGLGLMGFADALYQLMIPYDSPEGFKKGEEIMRFIREKSMEKSIELAKTRGTFGAYKGSIWEKKGIKIRNSYLTTVAPTGTIGMIAEASGGLEPNFAICFIKNVMDNTELIYTNSYFEEIAKERGFYSKDLMSEIAKVGTIQGFEEIPEDIRRVFVTAQDITPENHIRMQGAFQKHVCASVSKTINFPNSASMREVETAYILAHELGCKGVTIYRDGSRDGQVLNIGKVKRAVSEVAVQQTIQQAVPMEAKVEEFIPPPAAPVAVATSNIPIMKTAPTMETVAVAEMQPVRSHRAVGGSPSSASVKSKSQILADRTCPECNGQVQIGEGCLLCLSCGFSACSV